MKSAIQTLQSPIVCETSSTQLVFRLLSASLCTLLICSVAGIAPAQQIRVMSRAITPSNFQEPSDAPMVEVELNAAELATGEQAVTATPSASDGKFDEDKLRLESLLKVQFDRSPAAVLAAWAAERLPERKDPPEELPEETAEAVAEPAAEQAKPNPEQILITEKTKAIQEEVKQYERWVTLGRWPEIGDYLAKLSEKNRDKVYLKLLQGLAANPPGERPSNVPELAQSRQALTPEDIVALADASPNPLTEKHLTPLSRMLSKSVGNGYVINGSVEIIRKGTKRLGGDDPQLRAAAALLILDAGAPESAVEFLPSWPTPEDAIDNFGLKLLAKYFDGRYAKEAKPDWLKQSWEVHQILLGREDLKVAERKAVLQRAVELSTLIDKNIGQTWLEESFSNDVKRGIEILSQLGGAAAAEMKSNYHSPARRLSLLRLQNKAAESLLQASPERASEWTQTLTLLAEQWNREAELARQFSGANYGGMNMSYDRFGNFYYQDSGPGENPYGQRGTSIDVQDLLAIQPSQTWVGLLDPALQPKVATLRAQLHLKIGEEAKAFPLIEQLAPQQPEIARELVHEFLKSWTTNHDPNQERRMYNPYSYIFGYNANAEAIPLSRSRQQRNLEELRTWVARIQKLPIESIDESLLAAAFTTCHSSAEVFQIEAFNAVFGDIQSLKPETIVSITDTMRGNLASVWRQMRNQEANKTRRKEHEVIQEVVRGYQVALAVVQEARSKYHDDWRLLLAEATLLFDFNSYVQAVSPTTEYLEIRDSAFKKFQQAAELYHEAVSTLDIKKQSTDVYDYWFYAALGSTDLAQLSNLTSPDQKQFPLIAAAIENLPGETAETHLAKFATKMFTRLSAVPPQAKYRFLKGGFSIIDDHPLAWEAKKTFDYYNDTVNEIKLIAELDGSNNVGHTRPFGVIVKLVHTNEMERESGGFSKYVQNQTQAPYFYNYGRPNEDYREKFEDGVRTALAENFEIISITFESPKEMRSRPDRKDGWRQTPYAYLLLKARGPQIDRFPPLQLNLDFMDAAGFVVLPIESPALVIDASSSRPPTRPYRSLSVVQTLDERQVDEGKLLLEVRASATGLVPELDEILNLKFGDLKVVRIEDQKSSPTGFAAVDELLIQSDRSWLIELEAEPGKSINEFHFCEATSEDINVTRQQYRDADLVPAEPRVAMVSKLHRFDWQTYAPLAALGTVGLIALSIFVTYFMRRPKSQYVAQFEIPQVINPFTVLGLLERIQTQATLKDPARVELTNSIRDVQQHFFAPQNGQHAIKLEEIAQNWVRRVT